ncbi:MAG: hypothetical protein ABIO45_06700 [Burkholderiaceae bacterium]
MERFVRKTDYRALSLQDLLDAREQYQVHIANLKTVLGTAVGRYRIRLNDANIHDQSLNEQRPSKRLGPRTLDNSDIRPWSWPCVLVFVSEWIAPDVLSKHPELTVPPVLYLPDGRQVRTCVVLARRRVTNLPPEEAVAFATSLIGPGFQVFAEDQGVTRMGVASSIVADDAGAYVLTTGHVAGAADTEVYCVLRGRRKVVGVAAARSVAALPLSSVYPGFAGGGALIRLDARLVRIADVNNWTARAIGIGVMGEPIDLSADTLNLNLIGCPVFTELPGGRRVEGAVHGLFYRHAGLGGADTLTELLIGPRTNEARVDTRPGDSGVLWFWDHVADAKAELEPQGEAPVDAKKTAARQVAESYRPLAIQWGGQGFLTDASTTAEFALATSLSAICRALEVEVVRDWASDESRYWAKVGHYKIGYAACFALHTDAARTLFAANATSISVSDEDILNNSLPSALDKSKFIALADVPDLVWRVSRGKDKANHFADMDEPGRGAFAGKTLMQLWASKTNRSAKVWNDFYSSIDPARKPEHRGALPFRVAQLYDVMVAAVKAKSLAEYVCAAGVLAHYVGDACQPLHVSYLHHGQTDDAEDDGVHAVYEDDMVSSHAPLVVSEVKRLVAATRKPPPFTGAAGAADAVVQLMRRTIRKLPPEDILASYEAHRGRGQSKAMWTDLGDRTLRRMADGAVTLALIWQSAWTEGGGEAKGRFSKTALATPVGKPALKKLYDSKAFAESRWLKDM